MVTKRQFLQEKMNNFANMLGNRFPNNENLKKYLSEIGETSDEKFLIYVRQISNYYGGDIEKFMLEQIEQLKLNLDDEIEDDIEIKRKFKKYLECFLDLSK